MDLRHEENYQFPGEGSGEAMPIDLQLDLLVDEELPEQQRRTLLLWLDSNPQRWRDLSIRFLQRQVENKSIRELLAAKTAGMPAVVKTAEMPRTRASRRYMAIAAGLLVAIGSA